MGEGSESFASLRESSRYFNTVGNSVDILFVFLLN